MKTRAEIKALAKDRFRGHYRQFLGTYALFVLIYGFLGASSAGFAAAGLVFALQNFIVGMNFFALQTYRGEKPEFASMFRNSFSNYWHKLGGMMYMNLFTFIWSLLFIVPGIIKAIAYSMTPYLLADCEGVSATYAIKLSMKMTKGYKGQIFVMYLSFIGWELLDILTLGVLGIFYVGPYSITSFAGLYEELKANALANGTVTEAELAGSEMNA